jgi:hypothetical protein
MFVKIWRNKLTNIELLKIGNYRAPRDKVICVLNSCKVIFGMSKDSSLSPLLTWLKVSFEMLNMINQRIRLYPY